MSDELNLQLLREVRNNANTIRKLITPENYVHFLGEKAKDLVQRHPPRVLIRLALYADLLYIVMASCTDRRAIPSLMLVEDFLAEAHAYYREHLSGWDLDSEGAELSPLRFAVEFSTRDQLFGRRSEVTQALGRRMMGAADILQGPPSFVGRFLRFREHLVHELVYCDGALDEDDERVLRGMERDADAFRRQISEKRSEFVSIGLVDTDISGEEDDGEVVVDERAVFRIKTHPHQRTSSKIVRRAARFSAVICGLLGTELSRIFIGDEACELLDEFGAETLSRLAITRDILACIWSGVTRESVAENYLVVEEYIESALALYQEHLQGWDFDDEGEPLSGFAFLLKLTNSDEPFGFDCDKTSGLALKLLAVCDALVDIPQFLEAYSKFRTKVLKSIIEADGIVTDEERKRLRSHVRQMKELQANSTSLRDVVQAMKEQSDDSANFGDDETSLVGSLMECIWAREILDEDVRNVLFHIDKYGSISESEVENLTGGPRAARAFNRKLDAYRNYLPFNLEVDFSAGTKTYRKN